MRRFAALLAACFLASCTALPPPRRWGRQRREPGAAMPASQRPREAAPALRPLPNLTLPEALRLAREGSPTAASARERIARAQAVLGEAEALAYPTLDARGSYVRFLEAASFRGRTGSDVSGAGTRSRFFTGHGSDIYTGGADLNYPLFDGGGAYFAREEAAAGLEAERREADAVFADLDLKAAEAYLNVLLGRGAITIAEETLRFSEGEEARARVRADSGEGLRLDELRFATRASEARLAVNRARAEYRVRRAVLAEILGVPVGDETVLADPVADIFLPESDRLTAALENRPELRAVRARRQAAEGALDRESAAWWPRLNLFGSYGFVSLDDLRLSQREDELMVGGALSWNLFEGGATAARVARRRQEVELLRSREREILLGVEREVKEAEIDHEVARENVDVSGKTLALAGEVLDRITATYRAGEAQVLDVMEADVQRTQARLAFLRSQIGLLLSRYRLKRAVGW